MRGWCVASAMLAAAGGCSAAPQHGAAGNDAALTANLGEPAPAANTAAPAPALADAATAPLADWMIGIWSYGDGCATDLYLRFDRDGTLENAGDIGRYTLAGSEVTQTIAERFNIGDAEPTTLNPPEVRRYTVQRIDANHGVISIDGRKVNIQRC